NNISEIHRIFDTHYKEHHPSICVNKNIIYISYYYSYYKNKYSRDGYLKLAKSIDSGNTWETKIIDNNQEVGAYSFIAIENNYVYISYFDKSNGDLKLAIINNNEEKFHRKILTVDKEKTAGLFSSILVKENYIYISYVSSESGDLHGHEGYLMCAILQK
ncbi:MAG: hypothetical protein WH035_07875, partial [Spirochaetota bacterium]